jgi:hypothetical protein
MRRIVALGWAGDPSGCAQDTPTSMENRRNSSLHDYVELSSDDHRLNDGIGQAIGFSRDCVGCGRACADAAGSAAFSIGAVAGGFFVSREEYDGVFSAGDIGGGERRAFDFAVCGEPLAAVAPLGPSRCS